MTRATSTIAAVAFLCIAAAPPPVTFESPYECHDNHGGHCWAVKNDPSTPPVDASAIQAVTPSDVFSWPGPAEHLTQSSERTGIEINWFALTERVVVVKVEMDGDLHIALARQTMRRTFVRIEGTQPRKRPDRLRIVLIAPHGTLNVFIAI
jgi:hypothetical protein